MSDTINKENLSTYDQHGIVDYLKEIASRGKLGVIDMEIAWSFIRGAHSVLEIGAGYGRCIDFLLQNSIGLKITALEQSGRMFDLLKAKYDQKSVEIIRKDLLELCISEKFDAILLMWSVFAEFNKQNQSRIINKLLSALSRHGKIIIDLPNVGENLLNLISIDNQIAVVKTPVGNLVNYIPTTEEIAGYCKESGIVKFDKRTYATPAGRMRVMYILYKSDV